VLVLQPTMRVMVREVDLSVVMHLYCSSSHHAHHDISYTTHPSFSAKPPPISIAHRENTKTTTISDLILNRRRKRYPTLLRFYASSTAHPQPRPVCRPAGRPTSQPANQPVSSPTSQPAQPSSHSPIRSHLIIPILTSYTSHPPSHINPKRRQTLARKNTPRGAQKGRC